MHKTMGQNHRPKPWFWAHGFAYDMHKTIGVNHGFVHTILYVCFLWNTKYEKKIYKFYGKSIVSYLEGARFKTQLAPLGMHTNATRP